MRPPGAFLYDEWEKEELDKKKGMEKKKKDEEHLERKKKEP